MRRTGLGKARFAVFLHPWDGIARQGETQGPAKDAGPKAAPRRKKSGRAVGRPEGSAAGAAGKGRKPGKSQEETPPADTAAPGPRGPQDGPARGGGGGRTHNDAGRAGHQPARPAGRAEPQPTCGDRSASEGQRLEAAAPQRGTLEPGGAGRTGHCARAHV